MSSPPQGIYSVGVTAESGTFTFSGNASTLVSVSFTNDYRPDETVVVAGAQSYAGADTNILSITPGDVTTDGNGNIDGMEVYCHENQGSNVTVFWQVLGVVA